MLYGGSSVVCLSFNVQWKQALQTYTAVHISECISHKICSENNYDLLHCFLIHLQSPTACHAAVFHATCS